MFKLGCWWMVLCEFRTAMLSCANGMVDARDYKGK
jgi:hypothetical protein